MGSVMIDPESDPDEPYEMFAYREPCFKCPSMVVEGMTQHLRRCGGWWVV